MIDEQTIQQWEADANKHCSPDCCADNKRILALISSYRESQAELQAAKEIIAKKDKALKNVKVFLHYNDNDNGDFTMICEAALALKLDSPTEEKP